jgi:hypothetical protein
MPPTKQITILITIYNYIDEINNNIPLGVSSRAEDDKYSGRVAEWKTTSIVLVQNQIPSPKRTGPCEALRERPRRRRIEAAHGANRPQMNLCWAQD